MSDVKQFNHLFITRDLPPNKPGGIRSYYLGLIRNFPKNRICVLTMKAIDDTQGRDFDKSCDFPVYRAFIEDHWGKSVLNNLIWVFYSVRIILKEKIKVYHCGNIRPFGYVAVALHYLINMKYVLYFHGNDALRLHKAMTKKKVKHLIFKKVISNASAINVNSLFTRNIVAEKYKMSGKKIIVTNPGIDNLYIQTKSEYPRIVKEKGVKLITVGRLEERKGFDTVLQAVAILHNGGYKINYTIVGGGDIKKYQDMANELNISGLVTFTGFLNDDSEVIACILNSDIFVMPSRYDKKKNDVEGFGIVYLEASSLKRPVIAANTGGVSDAVIHNETGILINNAQSAEEVAEAIKSIILNPYRAREMAEAAYDRAVTQFNWSFITEQYLNNLSRIMEN